MSTKPPSGTGLAADESIDDSIEDLLFEAKSHAPGDDDITLSKTSTPPPVAGTPAPLAAAATPPPVLGTPAPMKVPASASLKTPAPTKTPSPVATANRDPSSVLPTIPAPTKEPSGAFPLPGMAPPEGNKIGDDDSTLIARLSVLDDESDESTKVEPLEAVLRAKASESPEETPINLGEQAAAQRDKALAMAAPTALDRVSAAEFEDPGDDDELTVSATPGIISIEEDEEETTASQRPPSARTPHPVVPSLGGPSLSDSSPGAPLPTLSSPSLSPLILGGATPAPVPGGPRLPAPTPVPGRMMRIPTGTPSSGLSTLAAGAAGGSGRVATPAFSIPAPQGSPAQAQASVSTAAVRSLIFKQVQVPFGGIVACLFAVFLGGFIVGAYLWQADGPASVAADGPQRAHDPASAPIRTQAPAPQDEAKANAGESPVVPETPPVAAQPAVDDKPVVADTPVVAKPIDVEKPAPTPVKTLPAVAVTPPADELEKPVRRVAAPVRPKAVRKPAVVAPATAPKPAATASATPAASPKPAAAAPKPAPVASTKPAKGGDKAHGKGWVDPFAE